MFTSYKMWQFWALFAVFIIFPQVMASRKPDEALAWSLGPVIILGLVVAYFVVKSLLKRKGGYAIWPSRKYLTVKTFYTETLFLECSDRQRGVYAKVAIRILNDGRLQISDQMPYGKLVVTDGKANKNVATTAGNLFVSRQKNGYRISWTNGLWKLSTANLNK